MSALLALGAVAAIAGASRARRASIAGSRAPARPNLLAGTRGRQIPLFSGLPKGPPPRRKLRGRP